MIDTLRRTEPLGRNIFLKWLSLIIDILKSIFPDLSKVSQIDTYLLFSRVKTILFSVTAKGRLFVSPPTVNKVNISFHDRKSRNI